MKRIANRIVAALALLIFAGMPVALATDVAVLRNGFTIRHDHRAVMGETTRLFSSADDSSFTDVPTALITGYEKDLSFPAPQAVQPSAAAPVATRSATDLNQVVNSASEAYHLDPDLVNSVIHAESGFNSHAVSAKGARGLMQLMPSTASALGVKDAFDPEANVGGGSKYLRELLERYNFDLIKALAAYNAGPQRVEQYRGVPPFHETRAYVARIVREYNRKKLAQEKTARAGKAQQQPGAKSSVVTGRKGKAPTATRAHSASTSAKHSTATEGQIAANGTSAASQR